MRLRTIIGGVILALLVLGTLRLTTQRANATTTGITYTYDQADRLLAVSTPAGAVQYNYDKAGNLLSIGTPTAAALRATIARPTRPAAPVVESVSAARVRPWERLVVTGSGFDPRPRFTQVRIGGLQARVMSASRNRLTVLVPPGTTGGALEAITPGGVASAQARVTVQRPILPVPSGRLVAPRVPALTAGPGITALAGRIVDVRGTPLSGVRVSIGACHASTDGQGRFLLSGTPSGHRQLFIDARKPDDESSHGVYAEAVYIKRDRTTELPWTVWLPRLDLIHALKIPSPTTHPIIYSSPLIPGLKIEIPAGTVIRDHWGRVVHELSLTPIPIDRTPLPLVPGMPDFFTLQPGEATVSAPGLKIFYPNVTHLPPGAPTEYVINDATWPGDGWWAYGTGRVSKDGREIVPVHVEPLRTIGPPGYNPNPLCKLLGILCPTPGSGPSNGDPVDLGSGLFINTHTDMALPDVMPISVTRTYRQGDPELRDFGYSQSDNLELFVDIDSSGNYVLQLPDGGDITFAPNSSGNYVAQGTPTGFVGATMVRTGDNSFQMTLTDGTTYTFGANHGYLVAITDRYGNTVQIVRDPNTLQLQEVISPNGRWMAFTWGLCITGSSPASCITKVSDNIGRSVSYGYDGLGRLTSVTDVGGNVTTYGWGSCSTSGAAACYQLDTITDPRHITYLTTAYDSSDGRVQQQTLANGGTYKFAYTVNGNNQVTETDVTDPRGYVNKVTYDSSGFSLADTLAAGTSVAQTTTVTRDPTTELVTDSVDPLHRDTHYTYDALGNVLAISQLYGTSTARTVSFTYEPKFNRVATVMDPLGHIASFSYDDMRGTITATDPLGNQSITTTSHGQPTSITDPLGHTTYLSYLNGDLIYLADAAGDVTTRYLDGAGRMLQSTDPRGFTTYYQVDNLNHVQAVTDPLGNVTKVGYDANSNVTSVSDPNNNVTTYKPNTMDEVGSRTDALGKMSSYIYDKLGNLIQVTDRNGTVTKLFYDPLNRLSKIEYGVSGSTAQSTITYSYDAANRLKTAADSASGTYTQTFDGLDHLTSATGPTGSVSYTYDLAERRKSMTVSGQPTVAYVYSNDNQLRNISNGSQTVSITYDAAGRRKSVTLPDGIVETYAYDNANRVVGITSNHGSTSVGSLTYGYDANGNRTSVAGTLASTNLPALSTTSSVYNADNELTSFNGTSLTYDANGNLLTDGTNTYTWDPRGQLSTITGGASASFQYDPFGRRIQKTVGATATGFLYDRSNIVRELNGSTPSATELTGLGLDDTFSRTDSSGTSSFLTDALGSTVALGTSAGALGTQYTYDPYGKPTMSGSVSTNPFEFTGRENDGTGLQYNRARYYSSTLGRFISQDPTGFEGSGTDLYSYASDNPVNSVDPSGQQLLAGCAIGAAFSAASDLFDWLGGRKVTLGQAVGDAVGGCVTNALGGYLFDLFGGAAFKVFKVILDDPVARNEVEDTVVAAAESRTASAAAESETASIPESAQGVRDYIESHGGEPPPGYVGGRTFGNREGNLPSTDANGSPITYREYDVNPYQQGVNRGPERIVVGSNGSAYYTNDHYGTFTPFP